MDDKKLWKILGSSKDVEPSTNFRLKFWQRVEGLEEKRRSLVFRRLVPALATLAILLVALLISLPKSSRYSEIPLIAQKTIENFTTEELLAEVVNYSDAKTIVAETFSSEEILIAFIPEEVLEGMQIINEKGGEKNFNEI